MISAKYIRGLRIGRFNSMVVEAPTAKEAIDLLRMKILDTYFRDDEFRVNTIPTIWFHYGEQSEEVIDDHFRNDHLHRYFKYFLNEVPIYDVDREGKAFRTVQEAVLSAFLNGTHIHSIWRVTDPIEADNYDDGQVPRPLVAARCWPIGVDPIVEAEPTVTVEPVGETADEAVDVLVGVGIVETMQTTETTAEETPAVAPETPTTVEEA